MKGSYEIWEVLDAETLSRSHYDTISVMCQFERWPEQSVRNKISRITNKGGKLFTQGTKIFYKLTVHK